MPKTHFPRIIHRIWVGDKAIPDRFDEWWKSWIENNPGWECRHWGNEEVEALVRAMGLEAPYEWVNRPVLRADIGRLAILWSCGGAYVDADTECLRSIDPLVRQWENAGHRVVMVEGAGNPFITNAFGFSCPRDAVFRWMISESVRRLSAAQAYSRSPNPIFVTGPGLWTAAQRRHEQDVHVAPRYLFEPFVAADMRPRAVNMSRLPEGAAIPRTTYAVHHSSMTWYAGHS